MSSENRPGNAQANLCRRHGEFIGRDCPVCEGVQSSAGRPALSKGAYRALARSGLLGEDDE